MESDRAALRACLERWSALDEPLWPGLDALFGARSVAAGEHLARPGDALPLVLFVAHGLLRFYEIGAEGAEWNKGFASEGDLTGPFVGESSTWPSPRGVQALEPSRLLVCHWRDFERRLGCDRTLERGIGSYVAALLERKARRVLSFQGEDAAERYLAFLEESPALARRLAQYQIASYLGITDVSLSRLRRKLRQEEVGRSGA